MAVASKDNAPVPAYARLSVALPACLFAWFCGMVPEVAAGETLGWSLAWLPERGIAVSFLVDGLSLLFALLITGIGSFILLYASEYMRGASQAGRFTAFLVSFMLAMLGLVLSDNLIALFVFWELTTLTSFLLIGYTHEDATARRSALQGLFVTAAGALAMLAGFVLLGEAAGTYSLSGILASPASLAGHPHYFAILGLILAGAFTKSAQFPFHFWLPNAMAAPTPVSAYLHSATMVKAGVFLLARLHPALGDTPEWFTLLALFGGVTAVYSTAVALTRTDLKQVLAYTTVMALGTCVLFLAAPSRDASGGPSLALIAAIGFVSAHALYKGALFMVAGNLDHATGTREWPALRGLRHAMPWTFAAAALAALSMAGAPPFFGFVAKELLYTGAFGMPAGPYIAAASFAANAMLVVTTLIVAAWPFLGASRQYSREPHEVPWAMRAGPLALGVTGLAIGLAPGLAFDSLVLPATAAVMGYRPEYHAAIWHGFNAPLMLSIATLAGGAALYRHKAPLLSRLRNGLAHLPLTGDRAYDATMAGIADLGSWLNRHLQSGLQRRYILVVFATLGLSLATTLALKDAAAWPPAVPSATLVEWALAAMIAVSTFLTIQSKSRVLAICALGIVGTGAALIFLLFGAPDVALTQFLAEMLVVVIVAVVLLRLPTFQGEQRRTGLGRVRDIVVAATVGVATTVVLLAVTAEPPQQALTEYFARKSVPEGFGRNVVNVILVDFRALDTLGEITVLAVAGAAAYALIRLRRRRSASSAKSPGAPPASQSLTDPRTGEAP